METLEITSNRGLVLQFFEVTMNLGPIGILYIFGNQYIIGGVFVLFSYFTVTFFAVFLASSSLDFCVWEDIDGGFLFLFGKTSANSLEM